MPDPRTAEEQVTNPDVRRERRDADVKAVVWFGVGLAALIAVCHLVALWMFGWLNTEQRRGNVPLSPLAARERAIFPRDLHRIPGPRLQESEERDLMRLRREEDARLNHYGWADREAGRVRVPLAEALERMADPSFAAGHGIRVRPEAETARMRELERPHKAGPATPEKGGGP